MKIETVLDIPCGDFNWIRNIDLSKVKYIGADIVEDLVTQNLKSYETSNIQFKHINLMSGPLPKSDIIINRDCLVHLSVAYILKSLKNIKSSGSKYLLSTTFTDQKFNYDIVTGDWRTINLEKSPFNLPKPIVIIKENCTEGDGMYKDKSLGLWRIEDI